ncbi:prolipoprotein diacylglyceryl transferase [Natrinema salifodinae]|uniref:Uncharacterized protein n=1 Tax=Natrinema salifodinae TaxID=1202768 RepID=A0A1I0PKZ3_9EURY|nr:hypothetical protein [Natrinema salifodinae]SEW14999.1 hypothetical protein SAMN05216285_2679 [Natrinema salifodinae]
MSEPHDHDAATDVSIDEIGDLEEFEELTELEGPTGRVASMVTPALSSGTGPMVAGGLLLAAAIRALAANRSRAIPLGIAGTGLFGYGLYTRRSSDDAASGVPDVEGGTEGKESSDEASTATGSDDEVAGGPDAGDDDAESVEQIEFIETDDEPRQKPGLDSDEEEDPRRDTDEDVEIDLSDAAMADEASEATGPDPEQAQPAQVEDTEPDESPTEDASHMKVDPSEADESESEADATDEPAEDDESDESEE